MAARSFAREKRRVLVAAAAVAAAFGPMLAIASGRSGDTPVLDLLLTIAIGILVLSWIHYDGLERGRRVGTGTRLLIVVFSFLALFVHLFRTRGAGNGLRATVIALGVIAGLFVLMIISGVIAAVVLGDA
jgi:hypothetical protein